MLACFVSGFLTRGFYDSVRKRWALNSVGKPWSRDYDGHVELKKLPIDIECVDREFQLVED